MEKVNFWLKLIISVLSAIVGALGGAAMVATGVIAL